MKEKLKFSFFKKYLDKNSNKLMSPNDIVHDLSKNFGIHVTKRLVQLKLAKIAKEKEFIVSFYNILNTINY